MANCLNTRNPRVVCCLPQPQRGIQGERGPTGPAGPTGPQGEAAVRGYGAFYNNCPLTVQPGTSVPITVTMLNALPEGMCLIDNAILLCCSGVYLVDYTVYTTGVASVGICLNNSIISGSITNNNNINTGQALITTQVCNQFVKLINVGESALTLTIPVNASSNVIVSVLRVA